MAEKKVSVLITAKDAVSDTLRGIKKGVEGWSHDITKIAAGIGLADGFKEVGKFIKESIKLAADAYPKLGAGINQLADGFKEFRIQAGAAFLEVVQPAVPLLKSLLDWATKLAKQLPDAFDGARIVFTQIIGAFEMLPSVMEQAFGRAAIAVASFTRTIAPYLSALGIGDGGVDLSDKLDAFGNRQVRSGAADQKAIADRVAADVQRIAGTTHDFGPRALTEEQRKALEDARQARVDAGVRQAEVDIRGAGGPRVVGGRDEGIRKSGLGGVDPGELPKTLEDTTAGVMDLHQSLSLITEVTPAVAMGLDAINNSLLGSIPGFGAVAKAAQKAVGIIAKVEGAVAIAKGAVKVAESIWPFNPAGLASGLKMIATGTQLAALGGGGGGGAASTGGGGSQGSAGYERNQAALAQARARPPVIILQKGFIRTDDPDFQDFIRDVQGAGADRL